MKVVWHLTSSKKVAISRVLRVQDPSLAPKSQSRPLGLVWDFLFVKLWWDLNPKRAASVKKNSPVDCFLTSRCAGGYRMQSIGSPSRASLQSKIASHHSHQVKTYRLVGLFCFIIFCSLLCSLFNKYKLNFFLNSYYNISIMSLTKRDLCAKIQLI